MSTHALNCTVTAGTMQSQHLTGHFQANSAVAMSLFVPADATSP